MHVNIRIHVSLVLYKALFVDERILQAKLSRTVQTCFIDDRSYFVDKTPYQTLRNASERCVDVQIAHEQYVELRQGRAIKRPSYITRGILLPSVISAHTIEPSPTNRSTSTT